MLDHISNVYYFCSYPAHTRNFEILIYPATNIKHDDYLPTFPTSKFLSMEVTALLKETIIV